MRIDRDSKLTVGLLILGCSIAALCLVLFVKIPWISWPLAAMLLWVCVWQTAFHRVPRRTPAGSSTLVSSVADGMVVAAGESYEPEYLQRDCLQVSVYMNFFDVHANFWPVSGKIVHYEYHPGTHHLAFHDKSSLENEHSLVCVETKEGNVVLFKQIAGGFARRIVSYGDRVSETKAGEQCGIIKFGSRIDVFLPLDAELRVKVGESVRACESIIAELPSNLPSISREK